MAKIYSHGTRSFANNNEAKLKLQKKKNNNTKPCYILFTARAEWIIIIVMQHIQIHINTISVVIFSLYLCNIHFNSSVDVGMFFLFYLRVSMYNFNNWVWTMNWKTKYSHSRSRSHSIYHFWDIVTKSNWQSALHSMCTHKNHAA